MTSIQVHPAGSSAEEFSTLLASELSRWTAVAKAANIQPNE
jgi:tripartite-type tricarboxylate transporter receptor subunit TctC